MLALGIDVQLSRDCPFVVLDGEGAQVASGWLPSRGGAPGELAALIRSLRSRGPLAVGIDAPRCPLPEPRRWAFRAGAWKPMDPPGKGRHCEVAVRSLNLANPQWTPLEADAPDWMRLGFELFAAAESAGAAQLLEVFPSATYRALPELREQPTVRISLDAFRPGPKDMLDAVTAALTTLQVAGGAGCEVGGGDGLGTIGLPRPLTPFEAANPVLRWPG